MTDKEKKRFAEMAEKDKLRYDKEMSTYTPPMGEGGRGGKRKKKDPNAPKRPLSAFFIFCQDERPAVKEAHPTYSVGDVAKDLGEKWNKIAPEVKQKYEAKAQIEKGRYEKDMANYKNKSLGGQAGNNEAVSLFLKTILIQILLIIRNDQLCLWLIIMGANKTSLRHEPFSSRGFRLFCKQK